MADNLLLKIPQKTLHDHYSLYIKERIQVMSKLTSIITLLVIPYFIYEDLTVSALGSISVFFRIIPVIISVMSLVFLLTPLKKFTRIIRGLYIFYLISLMTMMCGLLALTVSGPRYEIFIIGAIVIIFCIYAGAVYGMKVLIPVYGIPLGFITLYMVFGTDVPFADITLLANPYTTAIVCTVLAELQYKARFREFISSKVIALQNQELTLELDLARAVQNNLSPSEFPDVDGVSIDSVYLPMVGIGGDLYDIIEFKEPNLIGIFISDVSGHGVPAALIASMIKTLINTAGSNKLEPGKLLSYINEKLIGETNQHFVTAFYGIYDTETGCFRYARGGHNYPYLVRESEIIELKSTGKFLAFFHGLIFEEKEIQLHRGDKILFYTDGLVEAKGFDDTMFEETLVPELLTRYRLMNNEDYISKIFEKLVEFTRDSAFEDDVCIVSMEITG